MPVKTGGSARVALVTGAGSGIGRAIALKLAASDYAVGLVGRTRQSLEQTAQMLSPRSSHNPRSAVLVADVSERAQAYAAVDDALKRWGRIDVLINNAAVLQVRPIESIDEPELHRTFAANVYGPFYLVQRLWPVFQAQGSGCVINMSSIAAIDPFPGLATYAASKSALESLTRSIRAENVAGTIRTFTIAPGAVETRMLRTVVDQATLPSEQTLAPEAIADVVMQCVRGERDDQQNNPIVVAHRAG